MLNRLVQSSDEKESLSGFARGDVGIFRDRHYRRGRLSISIESVACVEKSLMPRRAVRSMRSLASIAVNALVKGGGKHLPSAMPISRKQGHVSSVKKNSPFRFALFDQGNIAASSAPWAAAMQAVEGYLNHLGNLEKLVKRESTSKAMLRLNPRQIAALKIDMGGSWSIAMSWSKSWAERCTSGNPSITRMETAPTTIHPIWSYGSKPSRLASAWRMWQRSTALNWWPHDSALTNSKLNFHTVLPKLIASCGVSQAGLIPEEAI